MALQLTVRQKVVTLGAEADLATGDGVAGAHATASAAA